MEERVRDDLFKFIDLELNNWGASEQQLETIIHQIQTIKDNYLNTSQVLNQVNKANIIPFIIE